MFAIPAGFDQDCDAVLIRATACLRAKLLPVVIKGTRAVYRQQACENPILAVVICNAMSDA